jgi:2-oxoglutarate dehydrogenase E2 component (dihydrolipoamide succinyltransferase)
VTVGQDLFRVEPGEKRAAPPRPKEDAKPAEKAPEPQPSKQPEPTRQFKATEKPKQPEPTKEKPVPKQAASVGNRGETRVKMNRMRQTIAKRLKDSQNAAASLTTFNEIDMSALMALRKKYKDEVLKSHDVKLGYMSAFVKAACLALKEIPSANAYIEVRPLVLDVSYLGPI